MIKLILISHGSLAAGMREAAEMILGEQEDMEVFGLFPGDTLESFSDKIERMILQYHDETNTLILSDLPCGTPSNAASMMVLKHGIHALSGCNLPLLVEVLSTREDASIEMVMTEAVKEGKAGIISAEELLTERQGGK